MKERPILFSGPMVRAILDGRKTQTRRLVKHRQFSEEVHARAAHVGVRAALDELPTLPNVYGVPGDWLWVRETWAATDLTVWDRERASLRYRATHDLGPLDGWRPSIHMPRWASRITLEVTGVRVERLQGISEEDARAEGIEPVGLHRWRNYMPEPEAGSIGSRFATARDSFFSLWESINGTESLAANPWVWVIEFRRAA